MAKRILLLAVIAFFILGTVAAMAEGGDTSQYKNALQGMYECFSGWKRPCAKGAETCKCCGKKCCAACKTDCGGKCCSECGKK